MKFMLMVTLGLLAFASVADATVMRTSPKPAEAAREEAAATAERSPAAKPVRVSPPEVREEAGNAERTEPEAREGAVATAERTEPEAREVAVATGERVEEQAREGAVATAERAEEQVREGGANVERAQEQAREGGANAERVQEAAREVAAATAEQAQPEAAGALPQAGGNPFGRIGGFSPFPGINLPGFGARAPRGSVLTTSLLNGEGSSEIASGLSETTGNGQIFTTKENGGLATATGQQNTRVQGNGQSRGQISLNGAADLVGDNGSRSTTFGGGLSGFFTGDGESQGTGSTDFSAFANPTSTGGTINSVSGASGERGALSQTSIFLGGQDP